MAKKDTLDVFARSGSCMESGAALSRKAYFATRIHTLRTFKFGPTSILPTWSSTSSLSEESDLAFCFSRRKIVFSWFLLFWQFVLVMIYGSHLVALSFETWRRFHVFVTEKKTYFFLFWCGRDVECRASVHWWACCRTFRQRVGFGCLGPISSLPFRTPAQSFTQKLIGTCSGLFLGLGGVGFPFSILYRLCVFDFWGCSSDRWLLVLLGTCIGFVPFILSVFLMSKLEAVPGNSRCRPHISVSIEDTIKFISFLLRDIKRCAISIISTSICTSL